MSLSIAKFPVLIWHLYLGDEVQLFYLHMNMGLQQLVKKPFDSFSFHAQLGAFFYLILFSFCFLFFDADPPLAVGYILFFYLQGFAYLFKSFPVCSF